MQLRVARLCLNCEELHVDNSCPSCASETFAYLSEWLPSEERRRWRRPPPRTPLMPHQGGIEAITHAITRWFRGEDRVGTPVGPHTRRTDQVVNLNFDGAEEPRKTPVAKPELSKDQGR